MWTTEQRQAHERRGLRYPSDLTDAEWTLVEPFIPPAKRGGRRRTVDVREVLNGLLYVLATGCQWRALPKDLPPKSTVHDYLTLWAWDGTLRRLHHALFVQAREQDGKEPSPTRRHRRHPERQDAEKGGARRSQRLRRGQEGQGQEAARRGRHLGLLLGVTSTPPTSRTRTGSAPCCGGEAALPVAEGGVRRRRLRPARGPAGLLPARPLTLIIVRRLAGTEGFVLLPRRWVALPCTMLPS